MNLEFALTIAVYTLATSSGILLACWRVNVWAARQMKALASEQAAILRHRSRLIKIAEGKLELAEAEIEQMRKSQEAYKKMDERPFDYLYSSWRKLYVYPPPPHQLYWFDGGGESPD